MEDLLSKVKAYCKENSRKSRAEMSEYANKIAPDYQKGHNTGYCLGYAHALEAVESIILGRDIVERA